MRLRSGLPLTLVIDVSDGWIVESTARLLPGSSVEIVLAPGHGDQARRAVITRCEVVAIDRRHGVRYRARLRAAGTVDAEDLAAGLRQGNELLTHGGHDVHALAP
jgi:hypothetical protein